MYNENPFKSFSASKMSENQRFNVSVEYINLFGKTIRIQCKSRKAFNEARQFLSIFKSETAKLNSILCETITLIEAIVVSAISLFGYVFFKTVYEFFFQTPKSK